MSYNSTLICFQTPGNLRLFICIYKFHFLSFLFFSVKLSQLSVFLCTMTKFWDGGFFLTTQMKGNGRQWEEKQKCRIFPTENNHLWWLIKMDKAAPPQPQTKTWLHGPTIKPDLGIAKHHHHSWKTALTSVSWQYVFSDRVFVFPW